MSRLLVVLATVLLAGCESVAVNADDKNIQAQIDAFRKDETNHIYQSNAPSTLMAEDPSRAQRIIVAFNVYDESTTAPYYCPSKVRVLDNVCNGRSDHPAVACRFTEDSSEFENNTKVRKLVWRARAEKIPNQDPEFWITFSGFASGDSPCKPGTGKNWAGNQTPSTKKVCILKSGLDLNVDPGRDAYIKYNIHSVETDGLIKKCDVLDPYFIIRK